MGLERGSMTRAQKLASPHKETSHQCEFKFELDYRGIGVASPHKETSHKDVNEGTLIKDALGSISP